jgi:lipopolysaccharide/colanic/teichoic acid biosynthesis glycosyltransferase
MATMTTSPGTSASLAPHHQPARPPHLLNEDLFRGVLVRERKRADRSNQPVILLLVELNDRAEHGSSSNWGWAADALTAVKRDTDILGWFEHRASIGLILTEISTSTAAVARDLAERVRCDLARRLDARTIDRVSIRIHVHPDPKTVAEEAQPMDPLLGSSDRGPTVYDATKRGLDMIGSLVLLIALSPLFLLIAALVKLKSPGRVFFRQVRVGQMRKTFTCLKFRTMHMNADHAIHHEFVSSFIKSGAQAREAGKRGVFKITNDPRVTVVGSFLRKTSLDELPQLWNVLRGDMSLVGPRPPLPYEVEQYQPWHCRRVLEAKPGITGLWQVAGRSRTTFDDMVRLDLRYAKACSLWTDLKILLATPKAIIAGKGAC